MSQWQSQIDVTSEEYKTNQKFHLDLLSQWKSRSSKVAEGGGEELRRKHESRGKLFVRNRVKRLLDPDSPFLEIAPLAACDVYDNQAPGAGIVAGIGRVSGVEVMIIANDATVKGGTYFPLTVKKHLRAQEIARENQLPCVYLVDSVGFLKSSSFLSI
jgi:acetyl-CoA carboxylase carboxyltransferase component